MLARINSVSPATRTALLTFLDNGSVTDPALVTATLGALRPGGTVSLAEQARMQTNLQPFLRAPDAATRQQALDLATAWAPKEAGTQGRAVNAARLTDVTCRLQYSSRIR